MPVAAPPMSNSTESPPGMTLLDLLAPETEVLQPALPLLAEYPEEAMYRAFATSGPFAAEPATHTPDQVLLRVVCSVVLLGILATLVGLVYRCAFGPPADDKEGLPRWVKRARTRAQMAAQAAVAAAPHDRTGRGRPHQRSVVYESPPLGTGPADLPPAYAAVQKTAFVTQPLHAIIAT